MTTYTATITEAEGAAWDGTKFTTSVQKGAATFLVDGGLREVTTAAVGGYANAAVALSACPTTDSFRWTQAVRFDSGTLECYPKLHFWGDGDFGTNTSGRMQTSYCLAVGPSEQIRFYRASGAATGVGPSVNRPTFTAGSVHVFEIEATAAGDGTALLEARWWLDGGTRPATAQISTTDLAGSGPRSGLFGYGVESGNSATPVQMAFGPLTVEPLVAEDAGDGATVLRWWADTYERRKLLTRNADNTAWEWA